MKNQDKFLQLASEVKGDIWTEGLFGMERENLRVDYTGKLALTPHPTIFGSKLKHPYITTDFSESQIEMRTPPLNNIDEMIGFMETLNDIVSLELDKEYLWPQSIPPILPSEEQIPIAQYESEGIESQKYREFLAKKYGPKNQLFSGIHFNLSFSEKLLNILYSKAETDLSYDDFKDEIYLKTARQILRLRWLYILLFGNSPVSDSSLDLRCKLAPEKVDKNVIGLSIRNSCYGYQNFGEIYPDYSSVKKFKSSISQLIDEGVLSSPKELYAPVRPKFIHSPDHISYLELRFIDINPLQRSGVSKESMYFLHSLAIFGLISEETDDFGLKAQSISNKYNEIASLYGLTPTNNIWKEAKEKIRTILMKFESFNIRREEYLESIYKSIQLTETPRERCVNEVLFGILNQGYIPYHLSQAEKFLIESKKNSYKFIGLENMELSTQLLIRESVKRGVSFEIIDRKENFIRLKKDDNLQYVKQATKTSLDNYASILIMENKHITKKILSENFINTPKGHEYTSNISAKADYILFKDQSIVIKPNQTNFGIGVTIIKENSNFDNFCKAIDIAFENDTTILIEEFIDGKEYRFFVTDQEVSGILHRVPANVEGDGQSTIEELVIKKNQDPLRGKGYRTPLEKIQLGEAEKMYLESQSKTFETIPQKGEVVYLRKNSNISTGGDSIDFTDDIPYYYKEIAIKAAKALNVKITGLDMIIKDLSKEPSEENYSIIELNFNPAIHIHCHPYIGINRRLNEKIMDMLGY